MIKRLRGLTSTFGIQLTLAIEDRVNERRDKTQMELSTLLGYLENRNFFKTIKDSVLEYATRNELPKIARDLYMRLFHDEPMSESRDHSEGEQV